MKVGQQRITDEKRFQKRIRARELASGTQFPFRIVSGPAHRFFHMWPTTAEDEETKVMKNTWRSAHVKGDERSLLDQLANLDKALKQKHISSRGGDDSKAMSILRKQDRYDYAIIPRIQEPGKQPEICILEANWSVYNDIRNKSTEKHPTKPGMLLYGLQYMYDLVLTKGKNTQTGRPAYKVDVLGCTTEGTIPIDHLDAERFPIDNPMRFFPSEDLALIEATAWELDEQDLPIDNEKLAEYLKEFPIDLGRAEKNNASSFLFFNSPDDLGALQNYAFTQALPVHIPKQAELAAMPQGAIASPAPATNTVVVTESQVITEAPVQQAVVQQAPVVTQPEKTLMAEEVPVTQAKTTTADATVSQAPVHAPQPEVNPNTVVQPTQGVGLTRPQLW